MIMKIDTSIIKKGTVFENEPMKDHTTMRAGGPARYFVIPGDECELSGLIKFLNREAVPYYITGNGSNLLVSDKGYDGVIINIGKNAPGALSGLSVNEDGDGSFLITAGAGCLMSAAGNYACSLSLTGFEPLSGIPGCIGGACIMNAGAYGGEIKDVCEQVRAMLPDGEIKIFTNEECDFRYRGSELSDMNAIVLSASFRLKKGDSEEIKALMADLSKRRREKQPLEHPSAGSTFKRPEGYFAGKLIEDAGLKGMRIGGAAVSEKHAGFVVNDRYGSAQDVYNVIKAVQQAVFLKFSVELCPEVKLLGDFDE